MEKIRRGSAPVRCHPLAENGGTGKRDHSVAKRSGRKSMLASSFTVQHCVWRGGGECILHIVVIENKREEDDGHDRDTSHCPNFVCFNWSETSDHHLCNKDGLRKKKSNVNHGCEPAHQFVLEFSERMTISCFPGGSFPQLPILPCTRWREMCRAGTEHSAKMAVTRIQKVYVKLYRR